MFIVIMMILFGFVLLNKMKPNLGVAAGSFLRGFLDSLPVISLII